MHRVMKISISSRKMHLKQSSKLPRVFQNYNDCEIDEKFAYRDAESAKRPNDLNQAIRSTVVVATNEWKYHAELDFVSRKHAYGSL